MDSILSVQNKIFTCDGNFPKKKKLEPSHAPKVVSYRQTRWNLEKHVKTYHGITALQLLIDPRQMESLREPFDESKKAHQKYCYSQDWMKGGGLTLWNATTICGTSKTSWPTGRRHMKDELENHSKDQSYLLEQWLNSHPTLPKDQERIGQERITRYLSWL